MAMLLLLLFSLCLIVTPFAPRVFAKPDAYIDGSIKDGWATYYTEWKYANGSCGVIPKTDNMVCALSSKYMQLPPGITNPNNHPLCGPKYCVLVKGPRGGAVVKVSDTCGACIQHPGDNVDLADSLYPLVANPVDGKVKIRWKFVDCGKYPPGKFNGDLESEFADGALNDAPKKKPALSDTDQAAKEKGEGTKEHIPSKGDADVPEQAAKKPKPVATNGKKPRRKVVKVVPPAVAATGAKGSVKSATSPKEEVPAARPESGTVDFSSLDPAKNPKLQEITSNPEVAGLYKEMQLAMIDYMEKIGKLVAGKKDKNLKVVYTGAKNGSGVQQKQPESTEEVAETKKGMAKQEAKSGSDNEHLPADTELKDEIKEPDFKDALKRELKQDSAKNDVQDLKNELKNGSKPKNGKLKKLLKGNNKELEQADNEVEVVEVEELSSASKVKPLVTNGKKGIQSTTNGASLKKPIAKEPLTTAKASATEVADASKED